MVKCNSRSFFKDSKDEWHQPGTVFELEQKEAEDYQEKGWLIIIETASLEQPSNRMLNFKRKRKNEQKIL